MDNSIEIPNDLDQSYLMQLDSTMNANEEGSKISNMNLGVQLPTINIKKVINSKVREDSARAKSTILLKMVDLS